MNWCSGNVRTLSDCQNPLYTQRCCQTCINLQKVTTTQTTRPSSTVTTQPTTLRPSSRVSPQSTILRPSLRGTTQPTTLRPSSRVSPQSTTLRTSTGKPSRYGTNHKPFSATISLCTKYGGNI